MTSALAPLWKIEDDLAALLDSVDTCPEELREELEAKIAVYVGAEIEKVDRVNAVMTACVMQVASADLEIKRLQDRKRAAERVTERLEQYLLAVIAARGGEPLRGKNVTFSARHSEALVITDATVIPENYKRQTISWDIPKDPIKKAIRAGQEVPGATIEYRESLVRK